MQCDSVVLGHIVTMDPSLPFAEALAVRDGRIVFVGKESEIEAFIGPGTRIARMRDIHIYPGFIDSHAHGCIAGKALGQEIDVSKCKTPEDCARVIAMRVKTSPGSTEYKGRGWSVFKTVPNAAILDAVPTSSPILLSSVDGHSMWMNTPAMRKYGIDDAFAEKHGPFLCPADENGHPVGLLREEPVFELMERLSPSREEVLDSLRLWQTVMFSHGYTGAFDAGLDTNGDNVLPAYLELDTLGKLELRTWAALRLTASSTEDDVERIYRTSLSCRSEHFRITACKVYLDGVVEAETAHLLEPYTHDPSSRGSDMFPDAERFTRLTRAAARRGLSVHCHAVGDAAAVKALECFGTVYREGYNDQRNALAHLQLMPLYAYGLFAKYGVTAVVCPAWCGRSEPYFTGELRYIGTERALASHPIGSFVRAGANTVFHSDFPGSLMLNPATQIFMAVTRYMPTPFMGLKGGPDTARDTAEAITPDEALRALTTNAAWALHEENRLGRLMPGMAADMTFFREDLLSQPANETAHALPLCTWVDGRPVYNRL